MEVRRVMDTVFAILTPSVLRHFFTLSFVYD
ncbi:hypothetical protein E2C01_071148 [Portunus trituberculatus]|uniref:Uncharacterized protein n=1 Tax=Portunus trituberculatus TaxID=210409 RepID=A0A5B7HZ89_PORTR|nr:hypothetical protein [Portunus trituberculatus]